MDGTQPYINEHSCNQVPQQLEIPALERPGYLETILCPPPPPPSSSPNTTCLPGSSIRKLLLLDHMSGCKLGNLVGSLCAKGSGVFDLTTALTPSPVRSTKTPVN